MNFYMVLAYTVIFGPLGDVLCKKASIASGIEKYLLVFTAGAIWFSMAFAWTELYKKKSLTEMLVMTNMLDGTIMILAGIFIFNEPITPKMATALIFMFVSMWLMR